MTMRKEREAGRQRARATTYRVLRERHGNYRRFLEELLAVEPGTALPRLLLLQGPLILRQPLPEVFNVSRGRGDLCQGGKRLLLGFDRLGVASVDVVSLGESIDETGIGNLFHGALRIFEGKRA